MGTTNQSVVSESSPVKAERAHYCDAGMTEQFTRSFSMGVDRYYKEARDLLDEGQFGTALIFSPFNYAQGNQYGVEATANYAAGGFSAYANFGFERGTVERLFPGSFSLLRMSWPLSPITSFFWIMISVIPLLPASLIPAKPRRSTPMC